MLLLLKYTSIPKITYLREEMLFSAKLRVFNVI